MNHTSTSTVIGTTTRFGTHRTNNGKTPAKGRRYCFAAAIQEANPRVAVPIEEKDKVGLVDGAVWAFCPQKKGDHKGDSHKVVHQRLMTEFDLVLTSGHDSIAGMIKKCAEISFKFFQEMEQDDVDGEDDDDSGFDDDDDEASEGGEVHVPPPEDVERYGWQMAEG
jgi:hypothetical protein